MIQIQYIDIYNCIDASMHQCSVSNCRRTLLIPSIVHLSNRSNSIQFWILQLWIEQSLFWEALLLLLLLLTFSLFILPVLMMASLNRLKTDCEWTAACRVVLFAARRPPPPPVHRCCCCCNEHSLSTVDYCVCWRRRQQQQPQGWSHLNAPTTSAVPSSIDYFRAFLFSSVSLQLSTLSSSFV